MASGYKTHLHPLRQISLAPWSSGWFCKCAGFLAFAVLTTNVTGHTALFAERIALQDWKTARVVAFLMSLFLAGALFQSWLFHGSAKTKDSRI